MSNGIDEVRPVGHIAVWTSDSAKAFLINSSIPMWYIELGKFEKYTGEQK